MTTTISRTVRHAATAGLQPLAGRFKTWRATRQRGQRIPEELWHEATALARIHGLNPTAAALKLNYYDLQGRLQSGRAHRRGRPETPVFFEVPPVALPPGGGESGVVELVHAGGVRLILHRGAAGADELLRLVELFLRHGR